MFNRFPGSSGLLNVLNKITIRRRVLLELIPAKRVQMFYLICLHVLPTIYTLRHPRPNKYKNNSLDEKKNSILLTLCQNLIFSGREVRQLFMLPCTHTIPSLSTQMTKDS